MLGPHHRVVEHNFGPGNELCTISETAADLVRDFDALEIPALNVSILAGAETGNGGQVFWFVKAIFKKRAGGMTALV